MSASYPSAVKAFPTRNNGDTIQASHVDDLQDEVTAIESGILNGTAPVTASNASFARLSVSGNSTLASTITIGTLPYIFPAAGGSTGQVLTIGSTSGSTMTLVWQTAVGTVVLLKSNAGTDTSAAAANVDTIAITGLTAKDLLRVDVTCASSSQATGRIDLVSATDGNGVVAKITGTLTVGSGEVYAAQSVLQQDQASSTNYVGHVTGTGSVGGVISQIVAFGATTAWTGNWTLALRHNGVTAGGTFRYRWSVYKWLGQ